MKMNDTQRKITQRWAVKEDDFDIAMVYMIGARHGRRFARLTTRSSDPAESEESDKAFEGHETPVMDEDAPPINKNTGGMDSPVLKRNYMYTSSYING